MALLSNLQTSLSSVYSLIGAFDKEERFFQDVGNDLTSVLAGLGRVVADIKKSISLADGDESPRSSKKPRLVDRVTELEEKTKTEVMEQMKVLVKEILLDKGQVKDLAGETSRVPPMESVPLDQSFKRDRQDATLELLIESIAEASGKVRILEEAFSSFKSQIPNDVKGENVEFKIASYNLIQVSDVRLFLAQAGADGKKAGYFYDCFSMGNYCLRDDSEDKLADRAAANRAGVFTSVHDLSVTLSFDMDRPPQFGFSKDIVPSKSPKDPTFVLPLVKTCEDFYDPDPYRKRSVITTFENGYKLISAYLHSLETRARIESRALGVYDVARTMNDRTIQFMRDLKSQVKFFYNGITSNTRGSTKKEAWALISEMLSAILGEIYVAITK